MDWKIFQEKKSAMVLLFGLLMALANLQPTIHSATLNLDMLVARAMNSLIGVQPVIDETLAWLSSRIGDIFVLTCLGLLFVSHACIGTKKEEAISRLSFWLWLSTLCLIMYLISCLAEYFIRRDTPIFSLHHFKNLQLMYGISLHTCPTSSFPSGHGLAYIFFAMMAWQRYSRMSLLLWCLAIVMLSIRLIVGLHWFSDIIFGSLSLSALLVLLSNDTSLNLTYEYVRRTIMAIVLNVVHTQSF